MLRRLAYLTCALSLLLAPSAAAIGSGDGHQDPGLVGTWLLTIDFEGLDQFRMLLTVNADGTSNGPLPHLGPGYQDTRSACVGPWKRTGLRAYQLNMYCLDSQEMNGVFNRGSFDIELSKNGRIAERLPLVPKN